MKSTSSVGVAGVRGPLVLRAAVSVLVVGAAAAALAAPPLEPLPIGNYSFDRESPSVQSHWVSAGDVLNLSDSTPAALVPAITLGFAFMHDDLDGLSGPNPDVSASMVFVLAFSVDRATVGLAPPDPVLVALDVPYNAMDQAQRGQAAGDQFVSTVLFNRNGYQTKDGNPKPSGNNSAVHNNYDEGGTDYGAMPATHSRDQASGQPQDNVDATGAVPSSRSGVRPRFLYFSATADSPSLPGLSSPLLPSGAHIFYNADPLNMASTEIYAACYDLGLQPADDVDGIIVFDLNTNGIFDGTDQVLYTLAPWSPSLSSIPGASQSGAGADVFSVRHGQGPVLFASAISLGLGATADNVDALDFYPCTDSVEFARVHAIRFIRGDWDDDGFISFSDFPPWGMCMTGPDHGPLFGDCKYCDFDGDTDLDVADFARMQTAFMSIR